MRRVEQLSDEPGSVRYGFLPLHKKIVTIRKMVWSGAFVFATSNGKRDRSLVACSKRKCQSFFG